MLKKFSVANYKIFTEEVTMDFTDVKDYDFSQNGIKNNLINTAIIYGKNGSGKSMLGLAIFDITLHLVDKTKIPEQTLNYLPAISPDDSLATFKYTFSFLNQDVFYLYKKDKDASLVYEELWIGEKKVLDCDYLKPHLEIYDKKLLGVETLDLSSYNSNKNQVSIVRYINANTNRNDESFIHALVDFVAHMLWFRSLTEGNSFIGFHDSPTMLSQEIIASGNLKKFQEFLKYCELDYDLVAMRQPLMGGSIIGVQYGNKQLDFLQVASSGTRLLMLFFYWSLHFDEISFLFLDEFNAYYHYSLSYKIASLVRDLACQTLMSTHDTSLLESDVLRPDCYFIMHQHVISSLPNLTKRELRDVHNLEKLYRNYGFNVQ